jgi:hypothetical protein
MDYQKREQDNSCKPNQTRAKGSQPENNSIAKKELVTLTDKKHPLTLTPGNVAQGR